MNNNHTLPMGKKDLRVKNRRDNDYGPHPSLKDRRVSIEQRKPEVVEGCFEEWVALMAMNYAPFSRAPQLTL